MLHSPVGLETPLFDIRQINTPSLKRDNRKSRQRPCFHLAGFSGNIAYEDNVSSMFRIYPAKIPKYFIWEEEKYFC